MIDGSGSRGPRMRAVLSPPHRSGGLFAGLGRRLRRRVFLYVHFANCYPESSQSPTNSHFCSFEPERYHRGALSSFNHFPQLLVLVGPPTAESGAARTHSTNRITLRRLIRSSACTTSFRSSTASSRSTVRVASRGPGSMYSPKIRLASSTARISVPWSGVVICRGTH